MHIHTSDQESLELGFGNYSCNWGLHMCGLYETEEERDEIVFGFLHKGCEVNDLQLYCPSERTKENFSKEYKEKFPNCAEHVNDPERFILKDAKEFYYPDGIFSPRIMDKVLNEFYTVSQKKGERNIRAAAEMTWGLEAIPGIEHLMVYESRLNYFIPGKPWISICLYNVAKFSGKIIIKVLQTHPYTITKGKITQNPFYTDPDKWLEENAPEFLN
ncbi:MAG TPA: MEDS domain-containing protein [Ignavibacteriaceae bacterium]|nr:MEDS domain-containing protein [Ignavibacteriaceae bacterium]